ncbi:DMSO reductase beta subunit family protein [Haloferula helveola]|uniref:DMSO reductase beta subunit family protein n=1 Tax=Haloferula helveola TaxID=490095 RepID=A0ABN6HAJ8_9BACT|nr:DMSO reductase beta subunit family protein [Haloferula helveola]
MVSTLQPPSNDKPESAELRTLIDQLIDEQKQLQTPVARFSEYHDRLPDLADHYRNLIPLSKPGQGEQYAFEVSLDRCTGCKACVSACHSLNGLDDHEAWRDTGTLLGGESSPGWQQTVTTACHHCEDPGCLNGCPVGAYEKEDDTGIVRHLDDQCIGCSYCILKCPYDVPKYSKKRGIVRKCDMCHQRLADGEAPACVQACPTEAIRIVKVPVTGRTGTLAPPGHSTLFESAILNGRSTLPGSDITLPTTRYVGRNVPASAHAADREALVPQHAHWPLVFMLVLTQAGIGLLGSGSLRPDTGLLVAGAILFNLGMAAATLHLGQPLKAWRFFLGLRTSWLSREILACSLFAPIPLLLAALPLAPDFPYKDSLFGLARLSVLPVGLAAVFTSVMIYHDTRRSLWLFPLSMPRFFGTVFAFLGTGLATIHPAFGLFAILAIAAKTLPELLTIGFGLSERAWSPLRHSGRLLLGPLEPVTLWRFGLAIAAMILVIPAPWLAIPILLASEILERQLFFQSVHAPKMPGHTGTSH